MSFRNTSQYSYIGSKNTLGGLPVAEQTQAYIATFKGAISAAPEAADSTSFFITYLVDKDGNISKVSEDSDAQRDIIQNFSLGDSVITRIDQGTLINPQLSGEHKILGLGTFQPILVSQTGSGKFDETFFINFLEAGQLPPENDQLDYSAKLFLSGGVGNLQGTVGNADSFLSNYFSLNNPSGIQTGEDLVIGAHPLSSQFGYNQFPTLIGPMSTFISGNIPDTNAASLLASTLGLQVGVDATGSYAFSSNPITVTSINVNVNWKIINFHLNNSYQVTTVLLKGDKNVSEGNVFSNVDIIAQATTTVPGMTQPSTVKIPGVGIGNISFSLNIGSLNLQPEDQLYVMLINPHVALNLSNFTSGIPIQNSADMEDWDDYLRFAGSVKNINGDQLATPDFTIEFTAQSPPVFVQEDERPYFTTGSATSTVLTASSNIASNYFRNNFQVMPTASSDFGFSPINLDFQLVPGDKIRFEFNEDNVFTIFDIDNPNSNELYLTLDRAIGGGLNVDNFVLYRPQSDGKFLTLNVIKNDPQTGEVDFTGIIIPKFASKELKDNASAIVSKLKQDGIIED